MRGMPKGEQTHIALLAFVILVEQHHSIPYSHGSDSDRPGGTSHA